MDVIETQVTVPGASPVTLAVTEYGEPNAETHVLLVHGFPDDQLMWRPVVEALPLDWHAVTYDVRGAGRSGRPTAVAAYRTEQLVEDFIAVLDATVPAGARVHVVAHDWGSMSCWDAIAAETWDPRLEGRIASYTSISGPPLDHVGTLFSTWRGRLSMLPQVLHSWYVWLFLIPRLPELAWRANARLRPFVRRLDPTIDLLPWGSRTAANAVPSVNLYRANVLRRVRSPLPWRTSVPVQLVVPTRDPWITSRTISGLEARCRDLTRVDLDAGHWVPHALPRELADLVAGFARRHG